MRGGGGPRRPEAGEADVVEGRITIVQEDRIRVIDEAGRGYLFIVRPRVATTRRLERWRDEATRLRVAFQGTPDAGAVATRIEED